MISHGLHVPSTGHDKERFRIAYKINDNTFRTMFVFEYHRRRVTALNIQFIKRKAVEP